MFVIGSLFLGGVYILYEYYTLFDLLNLLDLSERVCLY